MLLSLMLIIYQIQDMGHGAFINHLEAAVDAALAPEPGSPRRPADNQLLEAATLFLNNPTITQQTNPTDAIDDELIVDIDDTTTSIDTTIAVIEEARPPRSRQRRHGRLSSNI
jgi:hypothetical protein